MPINVKIDHARRWVEALAEGEVSLEDIEEFLDAVIVAEALPYRKLFDGRASHGKYTDEEVMRLAARLSAYASLGAAVRSPSSRPLSTTSSPPASSISTGASSRAACSSTSTRRAAGSTHSPRSPRRRPSGGSAGAAD